MYTVNLLIRTVEHHQILAYGIIYLGMIVEGDFFLISTGVLAHLGALNFWVSLCFAFLGALCKTFIGYSLGEFLYKKFNYHKFFKYMRKRVFNVLPRFKTKPYWSIFVSKFIIGANNIVIIFSGYEKINYKKFLKAEISASVIWVPLMMSIGYFFSYTALHVSRDIWRFLVVVLILFIIFIIFDKFVGWLYEVIEEFNDENQ
jgi:membrane protein DedA with SNARE-associated domain